MPKLSILVPFPNTVVFESSRLVKETIELAQYAEKWGYHRMVIAYSARYSRAVGSLRVSQILASTNSLRVGTTEVCSSVSSRKVIADLFQSLNAFHPNRIDMLLRSKPFLGRVNPDADRGHIAKLIEKLNVSNIIGSDMSIWIYGSNLQSAQHAGSLGMPFSFDSQGSIEDVMDAIKCYREAFNPSVYLSKPYVMIGLNVIASATDQYANYLASSLHRSIISYKGCRPCKLQPPAVNYLDHISDEDQSLLNKFLGCTVVGSKETVNREIIALLEMTKADELLVSSPIFEHDDLLNSYKLIAESLTELTNGNLVNAIN